MLIPCFKAVVQDPVVQSAVAYWILHYNLGNFTLWKLIVILSEVLKVKM